MVKGGHILVHRQGHVQQGHGGYRAGALPQVKPRVQHRLQPQLGEQQLPAGFGGTVAGQHGLPGVGAQPHRQQGRRAGNGPVQQHRTLPGRRAQVEPRHSRNVKPAHFTQNVQRVFPVRLVLDQRPLDDGHLVHQAGVRQPGAPASSHRGGQIQQHAGHRRGGGGVADAHLPRRQQGNALVIQLLGDLRPGHQGGLGLLAAHGRFLGDVGGAGADGQIPHPGHRVVGQHTHIHRDHLGSRYPGHMAHRGAALPQGLGHRQGDLLPGLGDPLGHHAVVGAEHRHRFGPQSQVGLAGGSRHPHQHLF